jgi:hypothetical protein
MERDRGASVDGDLLDVLAQVVRDDPMEIRRAA